MEDTGEDPVAAVGEECTRLDPNSVHNAEKSKFRTNVAQSASAPHTCGFLLLPMARDQPSPDMHAAQTLIPVQTQHRL